LASKETVFNVDPNRGTTGRVPVSSMYQVSHFARNPPDPSCFQGNFPLTKPAISDAGIIIDFLAKVIMSEGIEYTIEYARTTTTGRPSVVRST
jgi:hypothetical protein